MIALYGTAAPSRTVSAPFSHVQFADPGEVEQPLGAAVVEVQLDHEVGAARQGHGIGMRRLGRERLLPASRAKEFHVCALPLDDDTTA